MKQIRVRYKPGHGFYVTYASRHYGFTFILSEHLKVSAYGSHLREVVELLS